MIRIRIKGGLGNQLFQYAAGYALSERLEQPLALDYSFFDKQTLRGFKLRYMRIPEKIEINGERQGLKVELFKEKHINKMLREINCRTIASNDTIFLLETRSDIVPEFFSVKAKNIYMDGYFQSEKYFYKYRQQLLEQFQPNYLLEENVKNILSRINSCNSVAVHVRRGDFLKVQHDNNPRHYLLDIDYYKNALSYMSKHTENAQFFWFSDDIEWVKKNIGNKEEFHFISLSTEHADIDEMLLMCSCKHIIAANSTFSWWAAWLNENKKAVCVVPAKRYGNAQMIPERWVKL